MSQEILKRIAIIGLPGSGKSTLACKLSKLLNLPVHHLDKLLFIENGKRDYQEFISIQQELLKQESWIIEGCSIRTLDMRFARADMILYLRFPRLLCIWRAIKRTFTLNPGLSNSGCVKSVNWELLKYIWNFEKEKNHQIEMLKKAYPHVRFEMFHHPQEVHQYFNKLKRNMC